MTFLNGRTCESVAILNVLDVQIKLFCLDHFIHVIHSTQPNMAGFIICSTVARRCRSCSLNYEATHIQQDLHHQVYLIG